MAADIEKDDLLVRDDDGQRDAIAGPNSHRLHTLELPAQRVIVQMGGKWIMGQVSDDSREGFPQIGVSRKKLAGTTQETPSRDDRKH